MMKAARKARDFSLWCVEALRFHTGLTLLKLGIRVMGGTWQSLPETAPKPPAPFWVAPTRNTCTAGQRR
jgi:hypothetical protein